MIRSASQRTVRIGLTVIFAADGALFASWASRLPEVQQTLGGSGVLGLVLLGIAVGALPAMLITGVVCRRLRPVRVAAVTLLGLAVVLPVLGRITQPGWLFVVLVVFGICYGATDVAMNSAAVELAADVGRPIVPAFHGAYSLGGLVGASGGALAAGLRIPVSVHLSVAGVAGVVLVVIFVARAFRGAPMPRPLAVDVPPAEAAADQTQRVAMIVALAAALTGAAAFTEGAVANWSGIHLVTVGGAPLWVAPFGYGAMSVTQTVMRFAGPRLIDRFGVRTVAVVGAAFAAIGFSIALLPVPIICLLGYALVGIGLANLFPAGIAQAGAAAGSVGVSRAATVGYGGFLFGPPLIGVIAASFGLTPALFAPVLALLATAVLSRLLPRKDPTAPPHVP